MKCMAPVAFATVMLTACVVGPDYRAPSKTTPANFSAPAAAQADATRNPSRVLAQWWKTFGDAELDHLVERALQQNLDLQAAAWRIEQARAQRDATAGGAWPSLGASGSANRYKVPEKISDSGRDAADAASDAISTATGQPVDIASPIPSYVNLYRAGLDASWELDLFGGTRRSIEAAAANTQSAIESRRAAAVSMLGELGRNYATLRATQARMVVAGHREAIDRELLEIAESRRDHGLASDIDVSQARGQLQSTQAALPALRSQADTAQHAIAILLGEPPSALDAELAAPGDTVSMPLSPPAVPVGLPSQLLENRPDVRSAERQLAAATARVGAAEAQRFPSLSLTAATGFASTELNELLQRGSWNWNAGASLTAPIFDAGRLAANQHVAEAAAQEQRVAYRRRILQALQEVEDALSAYGAERERHDALQGARDSAQDVLDRVRDQYGKGLVPYLQVLDADRSLAAGDDALLQSEQQRVTSLVALYKALGCGWQELDAPTPADTVQR